MNKREIYTILLLVAILIVAIILQVTLSKPTGHVSLNFQNLGYGYGDGGDEPPIEPPVNSTSKNETSKNETKKTYTASCVDSDSGKNYFAKGKVVQTFATGTKLNFTDSCFTDKILYEYYCNNNVSIKDEFSWSCFYFPMINGFSAC